MVYGPLNTHLMYSVHQLFPGIIHVYIQYWIFYCKSLFFTNFDYDIYIFLVIIASYKKTSKAGL